ncbi:MAG TPA: methyltransferase domain-containing protein [Planctomycetota bacterium]|nr:methyltransferase domain-containing protein [Planctomycetota bacterium]
MPDSLDSLISAVKSRFARVALSPREKPPFPIGPESAKQLGYAAAEIDALPPEVTESFAGVGNPFSLGAIHRGETVLDIGCGAGLDSILAARRAGPPGKVIGIDMTAAMIEKAARNAREVGISTIEFYLADAEKMPLKDASVDVAITNGVFNLCVDKLKVLSEILRVLKPGGRLQMADIFLVDSVTPEEVARKGSWSD